MLVGCGARISGPIRIGGAGAQIGANAVVVTDAGRCRGGRRSGRYPGGEGRRGSGEPASPPADANGVSGVAPANRGGAMIVGSPARACASRRAESSARDAADTFFWPSVAIVPAAVSASDPGPPTSWAVRGGPRSSWCGPRFYHYILRSPPHISARACSGFCPVLEGLATSGRVTAIGFPLFAPANLIFYAGIKKWTDSARHIVFALLPALPFAVLAGSQRRYARRRSAAPEAVKMLKVFAITLAVMELYGVFCAWRAGAAAVLAIDPNPRESGARVGGDALFDPRAARLPRPRHDHRRSRRHQGGSGGVGLRGRCRPMNIRPFYATTHSGFGDLRHGDHRARRQRLRAQGQEELFVRAALLIPSS